MTWTPKAWTAKQAHAYALQERHLKIYCQEEASSLSSHQEAGVQATQKKMRPEKYEASNHICGQGQHKRGPSRGTMLLPWSRTRPFVNGRDESVFNLQQCGQRN